MAAGTLVAQPPHSVFTTPTAPKLQVGFGGVWGVLGGFGGVLGGFGGVRGGGWVGAGGGGGGWGGGGGGACGSIFLAF
jgi:hypothetical protein